MHILRTQPVHCFRLFDVVILSTSPLLLKRLIIRMPFPQQVFQPLALPTSPVLVPLHLDQQRPGSHRLQQFRFKPQLFFQVFDLLTQLPDNVIFF